MTERTESGVQMADDGQSARAEGIRELDAGRHREAVEVLRRAMADDPGAEIRALLGLAHYQLGEYGEAARNLKEALALEPGHADWQALLVNSEANDFAQAQIAVPEPSYFDADRLLAPPLVRDGDLPVPPAPTVRKPPVLVRVQRGLGTMAGAVVSGVMSVVTRVWGSTAGYHDRVWTNWYRRNVTLGILTLAYMRERLNKKNLWNPYPRGTLVGYQRTGQMPPVGVSHFRTADGSWNNLANPKEGAAGTRFPRNIPSEAIHPETGATLMSPNPREISLKLFTRRQPMREVPFLNLLAAAWIQFQNSDWINHGENLAADLHEIPLPPDDPFRRRFRQTRMFVGRTQADPTRRDGENVPITFVNEVTHWWDASQIYGSDQVTQDRLRSHVDGKLRLGPDRRLPLRNGVEDSGFVRNWWIGQSLLHTLFANEHNAICDRLKLRHPHWDDNRLFNVARLVNAAVTAKIHSVEWTPAILPNRGLTMALNANWYGILTNLLRVGRDRKTVAPINVRNPEMGGVVGNPINKHGRDYGLTQEFVEIYRLHSLLPETLRLARLDGSDPSEIPFSASRQSGSPRLGDRYGMAALLHSFGTMHPGALVLNNYPRFLQELSIPGNPVFDMGAVDILRARERGVPRYNDFRRQLGLQPIRDFSDLTSDAEQLKLLNQIYGGDVEKLDLLVGTLGEQSPENRPTKFGFGETMFQIFILNATRRLQADRFYTDCYNEECYTREGLEWIDEADLRTVILRHHPELSATGLGNIRNAFEPWDRDRKLDPERHPLREYDPELVGDPWTGEAHRV